jgi:acyl carrier protein
VLGGDGLAHGYLGRPELTAGRFVPDPFGPAGGRLYCTGDLVRLRPGGEIEFLGRIDQQVKLRGFRIELGEIEAVLEEHPGIGQAVATVREDTPGDRRLVAYVVPTAEHGPDVDELRRLSRTKLPPFMVPSLFVTLQSLPITVNGKLDRGALPAPEASRPDLVTAYAPPASPVQEALATIWCEVLGVDRVGIDDDFFALGGHSLLAVKMLAHLQATLGVSLPLGCVFDGSTIRELSRFVTVALLDEVAGDDLAHLLTEIDAATP